MSELNFVNFVENNDGLKDFSNMIQQIMELPESALTEDVIANYKTQLEANITPAQEAAAIKQAVETLKSEGLGKKEAKETINEIKNAFNEIVNELKPSENKKAILNVTFDKFNNIFDKVAEQFRYDIELPIQLDEGAQMPKYAHEDDAAADVYAIVDQVIPAHSFSNIVHTGVRFGTPEGWKLKLSPRSSIGSKTPMRLSNMIGLIDGPYRGELMILYDNLSDSDYIIHKGDRIAQVELEPVYRFKGVRVDKVENTERGEGGLGSTGK